MIEVERHTRGGLKQLDEYQQGSLRNQQMPDLEKDCLDLRTCSSFNRQGSLLVVPRFVSLKCLKGFYTKDKAAVMIKNIPCRVCIFVLGFKM